MRRFLYAASGEVTEPPDFWQKPKDAKFLDRLPEPAKLPPCLSEADLDYNWHATPELAEAKVKQPALFIAGERDGVLAMIPVETMRELGAGPAATCCCSPAADTGRSRSAPRE